jgi:hypothetical protein
MVLVALIFAIIAMILELIAVIAVGFAGFLVGSAGFILVVPVLVFLIINVLVVRRTWRMYSAANNGDIAALKSLNSLGWAIVALIFSGIIPGIMLLIVHGRINDLPSP